MGTTPPTAAGWILVTRRSHISRVVSNVRLGRECVPSSRVAVDVAVEVATVHDAAAGRDERRRGARRDAERREVSSVGRLVIFNGSRPRATHQCDEERSER